MRPRRVAVIAVLCGTAALAGGGAAQLAGFGLPDLENTSRGSIADGRAISVLAKSVAEPQAAAVREGDVSVTDAATDADPSESAVALAALPVVGVPIFEAVLPDAWAML